MPDWNQLVIDRLARSRRGAQIEPDVAEELAHHLEDVCEAGLQAGYSRQESTQYALKEVRSWTRLARQIQEERGGKIMLKQRIQTLWLPALVNMTVAFTILLGGLMVANKPLRGPVMSSNPRPVYLVWLILLPAMGGFAAYWSRRAGGSVATRATAALFPALTMLVTFFAILMHAIFVDHDTSSTNIFMQVAGSAAAAVILPAAALLAGASPFLRKVSKPELQEIATD
jgi:hypothetical protein